MTPTINKVPAAVVATISDVVMILPGTAEDVDGDDVDDNRRRDCRCGVAAPSEENASRGNLITFCLPILEGTYSGGDFFGVTDEATMDTGWKAHT